MYCQFTKLKYTWELKRYLTPCLRKEFFLSKNYSEIFLCRIASPCPRDYSALKQRYVYPKKNPMEQMKTKFANSFYFGNS